MSSDSRRVRVSDAHFTDLQFGKVIAAEMSDDKVKEVLKLAGMPRITDRTIVDVDAFLREIRRARVRAATPSTTARTKKQAGVSPYPSQTLRSLAG